MYDGYGNLTEVKDNVRSIWKADTENALGQATSIFKGGIKTDYLYDPINHQETSIKATGIVDYTYGYDSKNNLSWRKDNLTTQQEDFGYDELNRLTSWKVTHAGIQTPYGITYDPANLANIQTKSGIETDPQHLLTMYYGGKNPDGTTTGRPDSSLIGPHALSTISGVPASPFPQTDLTVTYTDFKKIATLHDGAKDYELAYGVDDQRRMSVYYANGKSQGTPTLTRYYLGDYEEEVGIDGKVRKIHYLSGAILIQNEGKADSLLYTYSDAQGSLIALTNSDGGIVRKYAYDPWGARRDISNWNVKDNGDHLIVNRGYTGHEHLDAFGIINMNGRVYDPATGMFLSPDPYVQAPGNWLNYNRYGYCYGNPFRYTDPSGQFIQIIVGAFIGGFINWGIHGFQFNMNGLAAFGIGAAGGALVALTCGAALSTVTAGLAVGGGMSAAGGLGVTMAAAGMGYTAGTLVTSVGNNIYFHDPMPSQNEYLKGLAFTMITAGVMYEIAPPQPIRDTRPIPNPIKTPTVGIKPSDVNVASEANIASEIPIANATDDGILMQGKVMTTVKGPDGKFTYVFKDVSTDIRPTVDRIASGESLPYRNDGSVFMNKEGFLPKQDVGYYKEFVHPTPNVLGPGAMRIVTGQGGDMWFTFDHYRTFIPIQ